MSKSSAKTGSTSRKGGSPASQKAMAASSAKAAPKGSPTQKSGRRKG